MNRSVHGQTGLTGKEATDRLASDGYNELPSAKPRSLWAIAWEVVREPMFLLLIGASAIYLVLGDIREALVLFASVFVVMGITFHQERKTERALEALRELASPRAKVLRDGEWQSVPGREVVRGDVVMVKEGDRVPADALLLSGNNLMADESLLTGESVPVRKRVGDGHRGAGTPRRGRSALRLLRDAAHPGAGLGARGRHGCPHRDRQDRQGAADARIGAEQHPAGNPACSDHFRRHRIGIVRARHRSLRLHAW